MYKAKAMCCYCAGLIVERDGLYSHFNPLKPCPGPSILSCTPKDTTSTPTLHSVELCTLPIPATKSSYTAMAGAGL